MGAVALIEFFSSLFYFCFLPFFASGNGFFLQFVLSICDGTDMSPLFEDYIPV